MGLFNKGKAKDADNKMIFFSVACCTVMAILMFICAVVWFVIGKTSDRVKETNRRKNAVNKEENLMDRYKQ